MFTVIIPLYNKAHTIKRTLTSVLKQTFKDFEVVIVNDGSTDNGVEIIKTNFNDARIRIIDQENQGVSGARNSGIKNANSEYIAFLDGDDEWLPEYLEKMKEAVGKYPNAGMFCCAGYFKNHSIEGLRLVKKYEGQITQIEYFENPHVYTHISATVISKRAFNKTQGFPVGMKKNEDFALLFSVALLEDVIYCGTPLSIYWGDVPGQATSTNNDNNSLIDVCNRFNLCHEIWDGTQNRNNLFLVFEKYELRHIVLGLIHRGNIMLIQQFINNLNKNILNGFSRFEILLWSKKKLKVLAIFYIYFTKIIWRLHGFPIVGRE